MKKTNQKNKYFQNAASPQVKGNERYCRFKKYGIKYIDYKEIGFLMSFLNPQGKILPRRVTGTSLKYQRKVAQAIKRARQVALLPYVADNIKDSSDKSN
jgi:small subunit ribosomal protein S18